MNLYVVTVIEEDRIKDQAVYNYIDQAVQGMVCELHKIAEEIDISYRRVKELEQEMWQSSRDSDPSYRYTFNCYDIYIKMFTVNY